MERFTTPSDPESPQLSQSVIVEAGAWFARLSGPYRSSSTERGFQRWIRNDPRHAEAFRLVSEGWDEMEHLRRFAHVAICAPPPAASSEAERHPQLPHKRAAWLPGSALAICLLVGLFCYAYFYYPRLAVVTTGFGEQHTLMLEDGTRIYLNTLTRVVVQYDERQRFVRLESGEALFEVAKRRDWPFVVGVGDRNVIAVGTSFLIRRDQAKTAVTLMEGRVAISTSSAAAKTPDALETLPRKNTRSSRFTGGDVMTLAPGERLTFEHRRAGAHLDRPPLGKLTAWQQGKVGFNSSELADAATEMNRYSRVQIVVERPELKQLLVSGLFRTGDSESFARAVSQTYGLDLIEEPGRIVLSEAPRTR